MPTKLWDVSAALTELFSEALNVPVFDGPVAQKTPPKVFVIIGSDGGDNATGEGTGEGADATQEWADTAGINREERGRVVCAVWAWHGSTDLSSLRLAVQEVLDTIEATLHGDNQLGAVLNPSGWARYDGHSLRQRQTATGADVRARFSVSYEAYITPSAP